MPRRSALAVLAVVALGASCAPNRDTGLQVKGYAADLVFGAATRKPLVPPGQAGPMPVVGEEIPLPPQVFDSSLRGAPTIARRPACPPAPPGAAAAEQAPPVLPTGSRPEVGVSRWRRSGSLTVATTNLKVDFGGFEQRALRDVRELSDGFAYQTVKPDLSAPSSTFVTTWQVKPAAFQQNVGALTASVTAGDPERGLTIKAIDSFNAAGEMTGSFRPQTGLLVLPLPVVPGEQFASVAVDPATLQVAQYQGQVVSRDRIDACGAYIEGWLVKGTLTFVGGEPQQYDVLVATQRGATVVSEHIVGQSVLGPFDLTFSLGQVHPG